MISRSIVFFYKYWWVQKDKIWEIPRDVLIIAGPSVKSSSYAVFIAIAIAKIQHNSQMNEYTKKEEIKLSRVTNQIFTFTEQGRGKIINRTKMMKSSLRGGYIKFPRAMILRTSNVRFIRNSSNIDWNQLILYLLFWL